MIPEIRESYHKICKDRGYYLCFCSGCQKETHYHRKETGYWHCNKCQKSYEPKDVVVNPWEPLQ